MKYICILLILSSFVLTGCFEKKITEPESASGVLDEQSASGETLLPPAISETESASGVTQEETSAASNSTGTLGEDTPPSTASGSQEQEMIQEVEEDLEALFDDLLKSE